MLLCDQSYPAFIGYSRVFPTSYVDYRKNPNIHDLQTKITGETRTYAINKRRLSERSEH